MSEITFIVNGEDVFAKIERLEQENEQLKALCDTYKICYQAKHEDIKGNLFKYKQTLEEIREMCKSVEFPLMSKIINIIDEVLE